MPLREYYAFRRELVDALARDIVGPSREDEILDDDPITRYAAGILYPQQSGTLDETLDIDIPEDRDEAAAADPPVALANVMYPSSMGLTFAVDPAVTSTIKMCVEAARYEVIKDEQESLISTSDAKSGVRRRGPRRRWQRRTIAPPPIPLNVTRPINAEWMDISDGLKLFIRVRPMDRTGAVPVTLVLINTNTTPSKEAKDAYSFYQPKISVDGGSGTTSGPFVERPGKGLLDNDEDLRAYRLLYRHAREFAVGHGCSVEWTLSDAIGADGARAVSIRTVYIPRIEVPLADSNPNIRLRCTEMRHLAQAPRVDVIPDLKLLCNGYESWITERQAEVSRLEPALRGTGTAHLQACEKAAERMRNGVRLLETDDQVWKAFTLANSAMLQQRARTVWLREGRPSEEPDETAVHKWRPFQLAFILVCLDGLARPDSADRGLVDLLWFPTGGGKTEAYLGLIAFTTFLRRLRQPDATGVTALMRYTLRLLTIQQFERAALLICCCEAIRRTHSELGKDPISIGLWVGQSATPNTLDDARAALNKLRNGTTPESGNPIQLHACPWCGVTLDHRNYWIATDPKRLIVSCRRQDCLFKDRLPVFVVDEDVYANRPTLLIATVDKFAGLPWREESAELFNLTARNRNLQPPPELIIQDELHLISGPLGTLVGLYETAVDELCSRGGSRPKVIASTATIRRAAQQSQALFNRPVRQFPPPGLDARNSYFAVEASSEERGSRMYVGLMAPGTSHTTLLVRAYAALLQNAQDLPAADSVRDPYWTLVGYFNSLRVLGGARMQVQDDVDDRMELLAAQAGTKKRVIDERIELTSREPSGDIPGHLKRMADAYGSGRPLDVILATNMISVGVDIDRLGLMVVMGQPQSTSEYIQSTSRVGRQHPGLVVVLFNAARSRDRSHYESFSAYHSALYRQVESTSVTPFSARARDRGLHAVLIALARLLRADFRANPEADRIINRRTELEVVKSLILRRVEAIAPQESAAAAKQLEEILNAWETRAVDVPNLVYRNLRDPAKALLADAATADESWDAGFPTLWSLRDVEPESNLFLVQ